MNEDDLDEAKYLLKRILQGVQTGLVLLIILVVIECAQVS